MSTFLSELMKRALIKLYRFYININLLQTISRLPFMTDINIGY